jgi:hypothetical protein
LDLDSFLFAGMAACGTSIPRASAPFDWSSSSSVSWVSVDIDASDDSSVVAATTCLSKGTENCAWELPVPDPASDISADSISSSRESVAILSFEPGSSA